MASFINVILSGGVGSRLWPLSRKSKPKQYIPLWNHKTLFQLCIERNRVFCDRILVVGNIDNYHLSRENIEALGLAANQYDEIIEATPRNTAAAIAFAAFQAKPDDILFVTPSDHVIFNLDDYNGFVKQAHSLAQNDYLVTFGIKPDRPETGFGYIEFEADNVLSFKEKPSLEDARQYCNSNRFLWNSGMFCFKASVFLDELKLYEPDIFNKTLLAWNTRNGLFLDEESSKRIPSKSVDYAVMEKSGRIKVINAALDWSDLGSFDAMWDFMDKTENVCDRKNLVLGSKKHVEILGIENIIFVETDDAILVMPRAESQQVKKIYEQLQKVNSKLV